MKQRWRTFLCWLRRRHKPSVHMREKDQRVLISVCDDCGILLNVRQLSKHEHRDMLKMQRRIGYKPPKYSEKGQS